MSLTALLTLGSTLADKFFPDPQAKAAHHLKMAELAAAGDEAQLQAYVSVMAGQLEINKEEAKSGSFFVAGWRPAVGWIGAVGLGVAFIPKALVVTVLWAAQAYMMLNQCTTPACDLTTFILPPFPDLGVTDLLAILGSMIGIGTMRSFDKKAKTDTQRIE